MLLVVPQAVLWTFALTWLMTDRGWSAASAGAIITVAQVLGAAGRIAAGAGRIWRVAVETDPHHRTGGRGLDGMLALTDWLDSPVSVAMMVIASVITVSDNGLAFTAIAEIAGRSGADARWARRIPASTWRLDRAAPLFGGLIGVAGYPAAFAVSAMLPLFALPLVPVEPSV